MDAGSSGSRIYLYHWPPHSGKPNELLKIKPLKGSFGDPLVKTVTPGLSSLENEPEKAFEYLVPLLDFAAKHIPSENHQDTPLFILATAGMRLIHKGAQEKILKNVYENIIQKYDFYFPDSNLEIISGMQEGIYQWLAINYVLDKFDQKSNTVGAIDMGGASMQIAVEVNKEDITQFSTKDKGKVVEINLGCSSDTTHRYRLFVTTFLGYGANEAINRYHRQIILNQLETPSLVIKGLTKKFPIKDPCRPKELEENITLTLDLDELNPQFRSHALKPSQLLYLQGTGDWQKCYDILTEFVNSRESYFKPCVNDLGCPDNGINMSPVPLHHMEIYGFSEFWYTMEDTFQMGGPYNFDRFSKASQVFCSTPWSNLVQDFHKGKYPSADMERLRTECIKSTWISVALHEGFQFPDDFAHLISAPNTVNGQVVHWTIGALLYRTRMYPFR